MAQSEKELTYKAFMNREYEFRHSPFEKEFEFYDCVKSGDIEGVKRLMTPLGGSGAGVLSEDAVRNLKYHFVITIAMMTRFCVEGGMEMETAYTLSDLYIMKADKCTSEEKIHELHREVVLDYTSRMKKISRGSLYSKPIIMAMDYIYDNLHAVISEEDIAEYAAVSKSYLSRIFHKEVGVTVTTYIAVKRIEAAQNMLKYSDYRPLDIGNYLGFSSHSHFISTFKKYTGMTPGEFRKKYYRSNWNTNMSK
ncbi:MAG: helix-turn-helix domain-containing protein [Oscillospiraceae bacterium]|nr:helix-turn-helix domain-containing protein [Oscillospiraceae bacterium]